MRLAVSISLMVLLCACSGHSDSPPEPPAVASQGTLCADPRPMVCTMEFNPTCGIKKDGERQDYASPCNACADANVASFVAGACSK